MKKAFGVWEIDTMYIKNGYIAVAVERYMGRLCLPPNLQAETLLAS